MSKKGVLIVFSAFSGSGKGTVLKELFKENPGQYELSVSATTRSPRVNKETGATEVDGKDYFFITREAFEARVCRLQWQLLRYPEGLRDVYAGRRKGCHFGD